MSFVKCKKCNKKLLERLPNGMWIFKFGKRNGNKPVVEMQIHGSIRMQCLRRSCQHWNQLNYFPEHNPEKEIGKVSKNS